MKKIKMNCQNCGEKAEFTLSNVGDNRNTSGRCTNCGQTMAVNVNTAQKGIVSKPASDAPEHEEKKRAFPTTRRKEPLKRLQDDPLVDEDVRSVKADRNPFVKQSGVREETMAFEIGLNAGRNVILPIGINKNDVGILLEQYKEDLIQGISTGIAEKGETTMASNNVFVKATKKKVVAKPNVFTKQAREFEFTEEQKKKREKTNMVFPEGDFKEEGKGSGDSLPHSKFDSVDRKDNNTRPDPVDFVPGYEEWKNKQVDEFYDGWVEDHIRNSGGEIVGSNTDKVMNLEDGEREHVPEYPTEAPYEKLLESRHEFTDYETMIANKTERVIKVADLSLILKQAQVDYAAQQEAAQLIQNDPVSAKGKVFNWITDKTQIDNIVSNTRVFIKTLADALKAEKAGINQPTPPQEVPSLTGVEQSPTGENILNLDASTDKIQKTAFLAALAPAARTFVAWLAANPEKALVVYEMAKSQFPGIGEEGLEAIAIKEAQGNQSVISKEEIEEVMRHPDVVANILRKFQGDPTGKSEKEILYEYFSTPKKMVDEPGKLDIPETGINWSRASNVFTVKKAKEVVAKPNVFANESKKKI
jgi:hypothetical protein